MVVVVVAAVSSGIVTGSVNNGNVNGGTGYLHSLRDITAQVCPPRIPRDKLLDSGL